nr:putative late blight resistance protein homolog R1B-17 [Ipomoea batatas]
MPSGIADLIHLRYLALNTIGSLYKFRLFKLQNLQTLAICSWIEGYPLQLPFGILDLPQLRHLHLERKSSQCLPSLVQGNLLTLYWLRVGSFYEKPNFRVVPNLKELGIYVEGEMTPSSVESLVHLRRLEKLKFDMGRVERFYLPSGFPPNIKKLTFRYTFLPWEEMSIIGQLPNLEVLKLKDFAFCGSEWEPTKRGFPGLKVLLIERLDLKHWNANAEHFPVLELLVLRHCWDLKRVPVTFANIKTLKSIVIEDCYSSLVTSAHNIANKVQRKRDGALRIRDLGTKLSSTLPVFSGYNPKGHCLAGGGFDATVGSSGPYIAFCKIINLTHIGFSVGHRGEVKNGKEEKKTEETYRNKDEAERTEGRKKQKAASLGEICPDKLLSLRPKNLNLSSHVMDSGMPPLNLVLDRSKTVKVALRSNNVRFFKFPISSGILPHNWFLLKSSFKSELKLPSDEGNGPDKKFLLRSKINRLPNPPKLSGILPVMNLLPEITSLLNLTSLPIFPGKSPDNPFPTSTKDWSLFRSPIALGTCPMTPGFERNSSDSRLPARSSQS